MTSNTIANIPNEQIKDIDDPRTVIADWLVNKRISRRLGHQPGGRFRGNARIAPGAIGMQSQFATRNGGRPKPDHARTAGHTFLFDTIPTEAHRAPLSIDLPRNSINRNWNLHEKNRMISGGRLSDSGKLPEARSARTSYIGNPSYWVPGVIAPADTGTRWGNSIANSFSSAANLALNPVASLSASIAPHSPTLDAIEMSLRGVPGLGKLASAPIAGLSAWSKAGVRAARRLDTQGERLANLAGQHRVTLHSPSVRMEVDLAGKPHAKIPTPHTKLSPRNFSAPPTHKRKYNTSRKHATVKPSTQQDIRTIRRFLER